MKQLFFLFAAAALFFTACANDSSTSMAGDDNDFRVKDTSKVTRIFIADRDGRTLKLDRADKSHWKLNDKYLARPDVVNSLLSTLHDFRVRFSVNDAAMPMATHEMATKGIKVEVYEGDSKKTFYVGGPTSDQMGTHTMMEGAKKIYVTHIANWEGTLTTRFVTEEDIVRDRHFFDAQNLKEIAVEYPTKREHSFRVLTSSPSVEPFYVSTAASEKPLQAQLLRSYLDNLHLAIASSYIYKSPTQDSITQTVPFAKVTLRNAQNELQTMQFFPARGRQIEGTLDMYAPSENYYCLYTNAKNEQVFLMTSNMQAKNLLWSYVSFYNEPMTVLPNGTVGKPKERRFK
jgi:Domain of unknown function (DUF4340)